MREDRKLHLCFVRGLNVFGRGKISIPEQKSRCESVFEASGEDLQFVTAHTNTGNLAISTGPDVAPGRVQQLVTNALRSPCAVIEPFVIDQMTSALNDWPPPPREHQQRWTPGF